MEAQIANEQVDSFAEAVYADLGSALRGVCKTWCDQHGYSDPFCCDGVWWAFPPNGVMPVRIKTVMGAQSQRLVKIGPMRVMLLPDGS
ncbi:MAG: hypothetical protein AAF579_20470, partial [Cyanobacteria bacterium P01_C01_bin.118]